MQKFCSSVRYIKENVLASYIFLMGLWLFSSSSQLGTINAEMPLRRQKRLQMSGLQPGVGPAPPRQREPRRLTFPSRWLCVPRCRRSLGVKSRPRCFRTGKCPSQRCGVDIPQAAPPPPNHRLPQNADCPPTRRGDGDLAALQVGWKSKALFSWINVKEQRYFNSGSLSRSLRSAGSGTLKDHLCGMTLMDGNGIPIWGFHLSRSQLVWVF